MLGVCCLILLMICIGVRFFYSIKNSGELSEIECSRVQMIGEEEVQSDTLYSNRIAGGTLLVAADGIGKQNIGKLCSSIAVKTIHEVFASYSMIDKPNYVITSAIRKAHECIKLFLDERYGGASIACGLIQMKEFYYAIVGDVEIWLYRNGSMIPITEGQTLDVLAKKSFENGTITREMAVKAAGEKRIYNFAGQEAFHKIELCQSPIRLQEKDLLLFFTKGVTEVLTEGEIRGCISDRNSSAHEKVQRIQELFINSEIKGKINASVLLTQINHWKG